MSTCYRTEERIIKDILKRGITTVDPEDKIDFNIYYRNSKTSSLIMKNDINHAIKTPLKMDHVVYKYTCPYGDCKLRNNMYIGMTTTSLSRRLTMHLQNGTPKEHTLQEHNINLTRKILEENTEIINKTTDFRRLIILEALHIQNLKPGLNLQNGTFTLPLPTTKNSYNIDNEIL